MVRFGRYFAGDEGQLLIIGTNSLVAATGQLEYSNKEESRSREGSRGDDILLLTPTSFEGEKLLRSGEEQSSLGVLLGHSEVDLLS